MGKSGRRKSSSSSTKTANETVVKSERVQGERFELQRWDRQIVAAMKLDIDSLALRFCGPDQHDLSLDHFCELFMDMELSTIFLGRLSTSDLVEFSENLLLYCSRFLFASFANIVPSYVVDLDNTSSCLTGRASSSKNTATAATRNDKERIFGVYLCYTLYFLQPSQYVIPIPVTAAQLAEFHGFVNSVLLPDEHFEALYCFYRLLDSNAFDVFPFERSYNPLLQRHYDFTDGPIAFHDVSDEVGKIKEFGLLHSLGTSDILKQISEVHQQYLNKKAQLNVELPPGAQRVQTNPAVLVEQLIKDTESSLAKRRELTKSNNKASNDNNGSSSKAVIDRRKQIREQAYSQAGQLRRDRRHRLVCHGIEESVVEELWPELKNHDRDDDADKIGEESGGGGHQKSTNTRKRRRSHSRTLELDIGYMQIRVRDPVQAQIMRELDSEQQQQSKECDETTVTVGGTSSSTITDTSNIESSEQPRIVDEPQTPSRKLQDMKREEMETDALLNMLIKRSPHVMKTALSSSAGKLK